MKHAWRNVITPTQRKSILRGNRPTLAWDTAPPLENGDVVVIQTRKGIDAGRGYFGQDRIRLSSLQEGDVVTLTIDAVKRTKSGAFVATYTLRDDRAKFLAPGNGYTTERVTSIDPDAEVVPLLAYVEREKQAGSAILRLRRRAEIDVIRHERRLANARSARGQKAAARRLRNADQRANGFPSD